MESIDELKSQLSEELKKEETNHALILDLGQKIAALEEDKVRFSIDAGVIDRLGQELVARQETAVSELVKNSYDADACVVDLTFYDSDEIGGVLVIDDNGDGMTREELVNGFMKISSTSKIHNPRSRKYKRARAGQKGIGRFSVQRLGKKLDIVTQVSNEDFALKLTINWTDYSRDTNLLSIANKIEVVEKQKDKGTTLTISSLRDKWTKASIRRVYRYVSNIIQPFPLSEIVDSDSISDEEDPGFKAQFFKKQGSEPAISIADKSLMIYDHAVAEIEGFIDESGIGIYTIDSKKLEINEVGEIGNDPDDVSVPFSQLKNARFKAYYYIYESDLIPKMHATSIRKLATREGGIRLYRNGFRVLPYGEPNDDWLGLDISVRRRSILPQHANLNFFGFVELKDPDNKYNETSSREGLVANESFIELQNFVYRTLMTGVLKVASVRNIKLTPSQQKDEKGNWEDIDVRIKNIAKTVEELELLDDEGDEPIARKRRKRKAKKIVEELKELEELRKSELKRTIKERSMLRVLGSVGLTVSQFVHEVQHHIDHVQSDIAFLLNELQEHKQAIERLVILESNFQSFSDYTAYFHDVVSQNVIRDIRPQNMWKVVKSFVKTMELDAKKSGITFASPKFQKDWLYTKSMHPSEWSSILFNLYTNSKKAIHRAKSKGLIAIECGEENDQIYLEFSDNGDGIKVGEEENIFEEFYTTTSVDTLTELDQNSEILGTGLGLKITKDIIRGYRGNIFVASPKENFATCIRIEVGIASEKELEENGL